MTPCEAVITERLTDRIAIGQKAVRRNLRLTDHTAAQVVQKFKRGIAIALSNAPADNGLLRPGHADENVSVALNRDFMAQDVLLLLADE